MLLYHQPVYFKKDNEQYGSVVECLTHDRGVMDSSLIKGIA